MIKNKNKVILTTRHTYLSKQMEKKFIEGYDLYKIQDFDKKLIEVFLERNDRRNKKSIKKEKVLKFIEKRV